MQYPYDRNYYPALPILLIYLAYPGESLKQGPLSAMIDTGADSSIMPVSLLDQINAPFSDEARLRSHWGEWRTVSLFTVDIGIDELRLPAIEVVGDEEGDDLIIGRDVLNRLKLLLDGPAQQVEILSQ